MFSSWATSILSRKGSHSSEPSRRNPIRISVIQLFTLSLGGFGGSGSSSTSMTFGARTRGGLGSGNKGFRTLVVGISTTGLCPYDLMTLCEQGRVLSGVLFARERLAGGIVKFSGTEPTFTVPGRLFLAQTTANCFSAHNFGSYDLSHCRSNNWCCQDISSVA